MIRNIFWMSWISSVYHACLLSRRKWPVCTSAAVLVQRSMFITYSTYLRAPAARR